MKTRVDTLLIVAAALLCAQGLAACKSKVGDGCKSNTDCSPDGDRICDPSQPGGYCTIPDCQPDTCPEGATCVQFWDGAHARTWCMKRCSGNGGCRGGYYCAAGTSEVALIVDSDPGESGFCIEKPPGETQDAGEEEQQEEPAPESLDETGDPGEEG